MAKNILRTTGELLEEGKILELIYDPDTQRTKLVVGNHRSQEVIDQYKINGKCYVPFKESNSLIKNGVVLFPSKATEYSSQEQLTKELRSFIRKYVDLEPIFEQVCVHYVFLSWVYDGFSQLPYLRKCGDFGTGKTRFLTVIGSLCYKPIFASGSSSTAAIFHTLDQFRGTLIFDEADFRFSDEKTELTKVLNNGFTKGYPVLRCSFSKEKEFDPIGYQVFGCKILASRKHFDDPALESRFISEESQFRRIREDTPTELPATFESEALKFRNKLLQFRFNMRAAFAEYKADVKIDGVEPRISQIFSPLLQVSVDDEFKSAVITLAKRCSEQVLDERANSIECHTLFAIKSLSQESKKVSIGDISQYLYLEYSDFHNRKITARWIGYVISKSLSLKTYKHSGRFYIDGNQNEKLQLLYLRYGLD